MKMPYTKNVLVTSCSQSHGAPRVRVVTSKKTDVLKPARQIPQSTIVTASRPSSACHLRWRCVSRTRRLGLCIRLRAIQRLLHLADQLEKLHRMRSEG